MAFVNLKNKEIQVKIVYYGPGRGGKTTNLEYIYKKFRKRINTEMGLTVIIIEHFMKVLAEVSKRLMILENGANIFIGTPLEVTNDKRVIECYLGKCNA